MKPYFISAIVFFVYCLLALNCNAQYILVPSMENGCRTSQHDVYDDKGQLSVRIEYSYDSSNVVLYRTLYSFDKQRHIVRRETYTVEEHLLIEEDFKYDKHGNLIKRSMIFHEEIGEPMHTVETRKYKYDSDGNIVHRTYLIDGKVYYEE